MAGWSLAVAVEIAMDSFKMQEVKSTRCDDGVDVELRRRERAWLQPSGESAGDRL